MLHRIFKCDYIRTPRSCECQSFTALSSHDACSINAVIHFRLFAHQNNEKCERGVDAHLRAATLLKRRSEWPIRCDAKPYRFLEISLSFDAGVIPLSGDQRRDSVLRPRDQSYRFSQGLEQRTLVNLSGHNFLNMQIAFNAKQTLLWEVSPRFVGRQVRELKRQKEGLQSQSKLTEL